MASDAAAHHAWPLATAAWGGDGGDDESSPRRSTRHESPATGAARRDGEIIGLHHEDGTPPYDVRWSDTGGVTLVFPGPDAHVRHLEHQPGGRQAPSRPGMDEAGVMSATTPSDGTAGPGDIRRRVAPVPCCCADRRTQPARRQDRWAPGAIPNSENSDERQRERANDG
ncbi:DUF1918 domain-containing protein [Streptomyces sp. NPDC058770]|uniref:DUF1918 domain-containing protein n=1 Tax=unclassified Streptomyces TaxID=2593676 RepID=UPI00367CD888